MRNRGMNWLAPARVLLTACGRPGRTPRPQFRPKRAVRAAPGVHRSRARPRLAAAVCVGPCLGELVQIDGCDHEWFEGHAPRCGLLVFVDDATSRLMQLRFVRRSRHADRQATSDSKPRAKRFSTRSEAHPYPHRDAVFAGIGATSGARKRRGRAPRHRHRREQQAEPEQALDRSSSRSLCRDFARVDPTRPGPNGQPPPSLPRGPSFRAGLAARHLGMACNWRCTRLRR